MVTTVRESAVVPVPPERLYAVVHGAPAPEVFCRRHLALPPIEAVSDVDGAWDQVGQGRTLRLADGGTARETLTVVDPPRAFGYRLTDLTGPFGLVVGHVDGTWGFEAAGGGGTRLSWVWHLHPRSAVTGPLMPVIGAMWHGYARKAFAEATRLAAGTP